MFIRRSEYIRILKKKGCVKTAGSVYWLGAEFFSFFKHFRLHKIPFRWAFENSGPGTMDAGQGRIKSRVFDIWVLCSNTRFMINHTTIFERIIFLALLQGIPNFKGGLFERNKNSYAPAWPRAIKSPAK